MNPQVWGHRGCRGAVDPPENSLAAFQAAIDAGAGGIELDIHLSRDNEPMVLHDATLLRTTGYTGDVSALPRTEIQALKLLYSNGQASSETIPALDQVLDLVKARRPGVAFVVNIELKDPRSANTVASVVRKRLEAGWEPQCFLISSFDMGCLKEMKEVLPHVPRGLLFESSGTDLLRGISRNSGIGAATVNVPLSSLTASVLSLIKSLGAGAVVWCPGEINPNQLPAVERDSLVQRLRGREFIMISDFPRDVVQLLRPNRARATATGVLAACLSYSEGDMLFRTSEFGLEDMKSPSDYPELKPFGFSERQLKAEDGNFFTIWERRGHVDKPHFLLFHGNRAHWGDTGPGDERRDRRARLKFVEQIAASGSGVTAVTLRGFGKSTGKPSELGFLLDIRAIAEHLFSLGLDHRRLAAVGESLGTWAATQTAVHLTLLGRPPALLSLQNPFTRMADVGEKVVSQISIVRSLNIGLSASALDRHILRNHFYTAKLVTDLQVETALHIATSGKDDLIDPSHSDRLAEIAQKHGLNVVRDVFPNALHHNIPPLDFAARVLNLGYRFCMGTSEKHGLWGDSVQRLPADVTLLDL